MAFPKIGNLAPAFSLPDQDGNKVSLRQFRDDKNVVLYFYPKAMTPGCTVQACGLRDARAELEGLDTVVLGVSPDSPESHARFREKYDLPFTLLADPNHTIAEKYGAWREKNMYGKKTLGIARSTFIIGPDGRVVKVFKAVKTAVHAEQVLAALAAG